jgi:hypothetical protein
MTHFSTPTNSNRKQPQRQNQVHRERGKRDVASQGQIEGQLPWQLLNGLERLRLFTHGVRQAWRDTMSADLEGNSQAAAKTPAQGAAAGYRLAGGQVSLLELLSSWEELPPLSIPIGLSEDNEPVLLRFDHRYFSHLLAIGVDGAGKTTLLQTIGLALAALNRQAQVQLITIAGAVEQPQASEKLAALDSLPHMLSPLLTDLTIIADSLFALTEETAYRLEQEIENPIIVLLIDDLDQLLEAGGKPITEAMMALSQHGAAAGVHIVATSSRPDGGAVDNLLLANMSLRLVGRAANSQSARIAAGVPNSGAERLAGKGHFLAIAGKQAVPFQAALAGSAVRSLLSDLSISRGPALLAQPVGVEDGEIEDENMADDFEDESPSAEFEGDVALDEHEEEDVVAVSNHPFLILGESMDDEWDETYSEDESSEDQEAFSSQDYPDDEDDSEENVDDGENLDFLNELSEEAPAPKRVFRQPRVGPPGPERSGRGRNKRPGSGVSETAASQEQSGGPTRGDDPIPFSLQPHAPKKVRNGKPAARPFRKTWTKDDVIDEGDDDIGNVVA